jgi:DNA-binding Xre family transcriptional regulator
MTIQNKKRRVHPVPEDRIYARERFRAQLQTALHNLMGEKGVSQRDLAERLGVSEARVSQMFGSAGNLTVRTVGEVFHALGCQPKAWVNDGVLQMTSESGSSRQQPEQSCGPSTRSERMTRGWR